MAVMDDNRMQSQEEFISRICAFADLLLQEVLTQRCDLRDRSGHPGEFYSQGGAYLQSRFCLPCLPVTNGELLGALAPDRIYAKATQVLRSAWDGLLLTLMTEDVYESAPRLLQLRWLYDLDEVWVLAIVLAFVHRSDPKYERAILLLQGDSGRRGPDIFLVRALSAYLGIWDDKSFFRLASESRAKSDLFETREDSQLILRKNVFLWLCGLEDVEELPQNGFQLYPLTEEKSVIWVKESQWVCAVARRQLEETRSDRLVIELQGRRGAGKKHFCREIAAKLGYRLCVIRLFTVSELGRQEGYDLLCRSFFACRVNGCIPYLDLVDCKNEDSEIPYLMENIIREYTLIFIGTTPEQELTKKLPFATQKLSLDKLSTEDSLSLWCRIGSQYPVADDVVYEQLAGKYRLLPAAICEVFVRAERRRYESEMQRIDRALLSSCVRECSQLSDNPLMERINAVFRWEDLKVKPETLRSMQLACAHLKHRFKAQEYFGTRYPYGCGISVLMYGPPGTGKTMAAQVMANELQMDLCRVDLSQVSSKYIGETEKNLEKIFREAEQANVILFFDEADSLFGKRTEVKDSNDKYANQETSYILQRIESYNGMVILATNLARNFDPAFMRRITVSIQFDLPDEKMRRLLWQDMLQNTGLAEDETLFTELASQFELTGSNIKNVVCNAVFIALMEDHTLDAADIAKALKIEFEKMGRIASSSNFGQFFFYIS